MRIRVGTIAIVAAGLLGIGLLSVTLLRSDAPSTPDAGAPGNDRRSVAAKLRARSIPKFQTVEQPSSEPPALPPPSFVPPPLPPLATPDQKAELRARASQDGYAFQEAGTYEIYVVQGGTRYHIKTPQEFRQLGLRADQVETVPSGSLSFLRDRPADGTLVRERGGSEIYLFENGQKRLITSPEVFSRMGYKHDDIKVVPTTGLSREAVGAPIQ